MKIDSTGYPCTAVIEHFGLQDMAAHVFQVGWLLRRHFTGVPGCWPNRNNMPSVAFSQLVDNYERAAKEFQWR